MNCLECEELLQERLDSDQGVESEALDQHLRECPRCRELHAGATLLLEGLRDLPRPQPAPGLARNLTESIVRDRQHRRAKWRRRVTLTLALAASIMLVAVVAYSWLPRTSQNGPGNPPIAKTPNVPLKPQPENIPVVPGKKEEPRNPLSPLVDRWVDTTREHARVVLVAANLDAIEKLPAVDNLAPIDPGVREASQEVTEGVRTVTRSARKAFDFFARELPMPETGDSKN